MSERGDDVGEHAARPDGGVGQVDDHVPGWIEVGGRRPDGDGLASADFTGDHADGALVHTPGEAGDRFACRRAGAAWLAPARGRTASG